MFKNIAQAEAVKMLGAREVVIIDVRNLESFKEGHIKNAIHLTVPDLKKFCETTNKAKPILVYCYHGNSSQMIGQLLVDQGFSEVYSLIGGFEEWKNHQLQME